MRYVLLSLCFVASAAAEVWHSLDPAQNEALLCELGPRLGPQSAAQAWNQALVASINLALNDDQRLRGTHGGLWRRQAHALLNQMRTLIPPEAIDPWAPRWLDALDGYTARALQGLPEDYQTQAMGRALYAFATRDPRALLDQKERTAWERAALLWAAHESGLLGPTIARYGLNQGPAAWGSALALWFIPNVPDADVPQLCAVVVADAQRLASDPAFRPYAQSPAWLRSQLADLRSGSIVRALQASFALARAALAAPRGPRHSDGTWRLCTVGDRAQRLLEQSLQMTWIAKDWLSAMPADPLAEATVPLLLRHDTVPRGNAQAWQNFIAAWKAEPDVEPMMLLNQLRGTHQESPARSALLPLAQERLTQRGDDQALWPLALVALLERQAGYSPSLEPLQHAQQEDPWQPWWGLMQKPESGPHSYAVHSAMYARVPWRVDVAAQMSDYLLWVGKAKESYTVAAAIRTLEPLSWKALFHQAFAALDLDLVPEARDLARQGLDYYQGSPPLTKVFLEACLRAGDVDLIRSTVQTTNTWNASKTWAHLMVVAVQLGDLPAARQAAQGFEQRASQTGLLAWLEAAVDVQQAPPPLSAVRGMLSAQDLFRVVQALERQDTWLSQLPEARGLDDRWSRVWAAMDTLQPGAALEDIQALAKSWNMDAHWRVEARILHHLLHRLAGQDGNDERMWQEALDQCQTRTAARIAVDYLRGALSRDAALAEASLRSDAPRVFWHVALEDLALGHLEHAEALLRRLQDEFPLWEASFSARSMLRHMQAWTQPERARWAQGPASRIVVSPDAPVEF